MGTKRITAIIVGIAFFVALMGEFLLPGLVQAGELQDRQSQLKTIQQQIQAQRSIVGSARKKEKSITAEITRLEREMAKTEKEMDTLDNQVKMIQGRITTTKGEIKEAEEHLTERTDILNQRLVNIYEVGDMSYLEVLLSASDFTDFITRWELLNEIVKQDQELIQTVAAERRELQRKMDQLEKDQQQLLDAKASQLAKEEKLKEQSKQKEVVFKDAQKERKVVEQSLKELEQTSLQIERLIQSMQTSNGSYKGTGVFTWPAPASKRVTSKYGMRFHPILKKNKLHTGIDIGSGKGTKIVDADGGKVIQVAYLGGYGNTVIVDHGNGISTLYAHMSKFETSTGKIVAKGDLIGKVGSTGWSTGPHQHFEVRKNGTPVNPNSYLGR
ncbi:MAG: peptidoglycan DD-metalloendopeptidase family protein [Syntrophomonadaceae bacterium]|nr:peptidoglycan DD-metalloendopeptidase family protein [Syntrophomonadaceae bacterium]